MQYKCEVCQDTGSISKHLSGHLDCISCDAATDRVAIGNFLDKLSNIADYDAAWLVHQRALAMAPKQEAPTQEPVAWRYEWASCITGDGPQNFKLTFDVEPPPEWAVQDGQARNVVQLYAAPAAANGAMTDEQIKEVAINYAQHVAGDVYDLTKYDCAEDFFNCVRAILAAAGPDAALIKALERIARWHGEFPDVPNDDGTTSSYAVSYGSNGQRDYMRQVAIAALSGAKGNIHDRR